MFRPRLDAKCKPAHLMSKYEVEGDIYRNGIGAVGEFHVSFALQSGHRIDKLFHNSSVKREIKAEKEDH